MTHNDLSGATRLYVIIGDPIAQVKAPGGISAGFVARGVDAILVPVQIAAPDVAGFFAVAEKIKNLDGLLITVPHKFRAFEHCASATERARFVSAANIMRRRADGVWHGEASDGLGLVAAVRMRGGEPAGKRVLQIGAGGAGSAIAHAFVASGAHEFALHDADTARRDSLIARLNTLGLGRAIVGSPDPTGFDIICNATPAGMKDGDPLPFDVTMLTPAMFVACVITVPAVTPVIAAARARGCAASTGIDMYVGAQDTILDFFLKPSANG
jgi:shikimate dehydrogenase